MRSRGSALKHRSDTPGLGGAGGHREKTAMADVIELARERREQLAAEVERLENFLRMATALEVSGDDLEELALDYNPEETLETEDELILSDALSEGISLLGKQQDDELLLTDAVPVGDEGLDKRVGKMIRHRRWMMGMTQEQLAGLIGLKVDYIQDYETGVRRVGSEMLRNIAVAMEVPVSFFFEALDEPATKREEI
jgi:transcriptional regulator with XRE-family HTH domain